MQLQAQLDHRPLWLHHIVQPDASYQHFSNGGLCLLELLYNVLWFLGQKQLMSVELIKT